MPSVSTHFTARIRARSTVARTLREPEHASRCADAGILDADLAVIQTKGEEAETHDRKQHEEMARQKHDMAESIKSRDAFDAESDQLRDRLPAVGADLASHKTTADLAGLLAALTFEQFRIRILPTKAPQPTPDPAADAAPVAVKPSRERVTRQDRLARTQAVVNLTAALLDPERAPVIKALSSRGFDLKRLKALHATAQDLAERLGGKVALQTSEYTQLETDAVAAQKERWDACKRMIRRAIQGSPKLEGLWAAC